VDHGFAVLLANYRGSTGYGKAWEDVLQGDPGRPELIDVRAGRDHLVEKGIADPERVVLTGGILGRLPHPAGPRHAARAWSVGIAIVPVADYIAAYADEAPVLQEFDRTLFGGSPTSCRTCTESAPRSPTSTMCAPRSSSSPAATTPAARSVRSTTTSRPSPSTGCPARLRRLRGRSRLLRGRGDHPPAGPRDRLRCGAPRHATGTALNHLAPARMTAASASLPVTDGVEPVPQLLDAVETGSMTLPTPRSPLAGRSDTTSTGPACPRTRPAKSPSPETSTSGSSSPAVGLHERDIGTLPALDLDDSGRPRPGHRPSARGLPTTRTSASSAGSARRNASRRAALRLSASMRTCMTVQGRAGEVRNLRTPHACGESPGPRGTNPPHPTCVRRKPRAPRYESSAPHMRAEKAQGPEVRNLRTA
jgi:hypothetical protein